jgi:hypothetical protein
VQPPSHTSRSPTRPPESAEKLVASALLVTLLVIALKTTKVPVNSTGLPVGRRKTLAAAVRAAMDANRSTGETPALSTGAGRIPSPHSKPHQRRENVAHGASRGITAHSEQAEPRSGDRRSAIAKTTLSPLPGLFMRIGTAFSPRLSPWATFLRPPRRAPEPDRAYSSAYVRPTPLGGSGPKFRVVHRGEESR